jgi:trk system potassium uptake protein TrkA
MRIVIAGATEEGIFLAKVLSEGSHEVVLIDRDPSALAKAEEQLDVMTLIGNPIHRSVLLAGQVAGARGFVALTGSDPVNMLSAGLAASLGAEVAVARVDSPEFYQTQAAIEAGVLGVEVVLCATRLAATRLISSLMDVHMPYVGTFAADSIRVALMRMEGSPYLDKPFDSLPISGGVKAAAVIRDGFLRPTSYVARLEREDQVLIAGPCHEVLDVWLKVQRHHSRRRAMVVGAGDVGFQLASVLSTRLERVEVIEIDRARAETVAEADEKVTVLSGDARSTAFLLEQQIGSVEHLIVVTGDDEVNLLVSLLGHKLGVAHTFTLLHRPGYAELYAELGVEGTVGIYELITRATSETIVPHGLVRAVSLPETGYSIVEWRRARVPLLAPDGSPITLKSLVLPQGVLLLAAAIGPTPLSTRKEVPLRGGETLILACPTHEVSKLQASMTRMSGRGAGESR